MRLLKSSGIGAPVRRAWCVLGALGFALAFHLPSFAQTAGSGTITGTITDPAAAVVPGASVVIHNSDTGADRSAVTNDAGIYTAAFLQPGRYDIKVDKPGFATLERTGITLEVGRTLTLDFTLSVKSGAETVTVTGEAPVLDTEKTEVSQEVSQNMVANLPIIGRRWDNFVLLTPGVTTDGGLVSYRGISGLYNNNSVDGANNNQAFFSEARGRSTTPYTYSMDSIQEFQVSASNYSAEFGQAAGGVVNAVTKSGTNDLHGDLFYYLRYPDLNALDPVNKANRIYTQAVHQQQQFGGSVGGAIVKDKLFYFFTYDGSRKVFPVSYTSTSHFPLACPALVTPSQCSAANGYFAGLIGSYPRTGVNDIGFGRLDYQLNSKNHLSANFDLDDYHSPNGYSAGSTYNNLSVTANGPAVTHTRFFVANWDTILTSSLVNNFRFQWAVDLETAGANQGGPSVNVTNVMSYGMPNALPRPAFPDEHRLQFFDTLSQTIGRHQLKYGIDVNAIHELLINLYQGGGLYNYTGTPQQAFNNWVTDIYGINTGDGLTGRHWTSFAQVTDPITGVGRDDFYDNDFAGFIEDSFKWRSNLTINMGLRYELQHVPQPPKPNTLTPLTTAYTSTINEDTNNFGPRIGLAYEPFKDTVVRAGYGMYYAKTSNSTFYAIRVENGVYQQTFNCTPATCPSLTFPNVIFTPPGPAPQAPFAGALTPTVTTFNPPAGTQLAHGLTTDFVNPLVHEGEVTIEHQLPGNQSISAGWLFSRGLHLPVFVDGNVAPATQTHTYDVLNSSGAVVNSVTLPWYTQRLNPQTGVILVGKSVVNSWYNGLVLSYRKPMSHGVEALVNYTYSKSIDDGAVAGQYGTFYGTDSPLDPYNQRAENALSDLDQRHRFVTSLVYTPVPFKNASRILHQIFDGWAFSGVVTISSGQPVSAFMGSYPAGGVDGGFTGAEVSNAGISTGGRPPQIGRNVFIAPGMKDVDFRIMRQFAITERVGFQVLAEAFNLFNHTNIFSVNSTAFTYAGVGSGACAASIAAGTNGCIVPSPTFLAPTSSTSTNGLYGPRQMQFSAKLTF